MYRLPDGSTKYTVVGTFSGVGASGACCSPGRCGVTGLYSASVQPGPTLDHGTSLSPASTPVAETGAAGAEATVDGAGAAVDACAAIDVCWAAGELVDDEQPATRPIVAIAAAAKRISAMFMPFPDDWGATGRDRMDLQLAGVDDSPDGHRVGAVRRSDEQVGVGRVLVAVGVDGQSLHDCLRRMSRRYGDGGLGCPRQSAGRRGIRAAYKGRRESMDPRRPSRRRDNRSVCRHHPGRQTEQQRHTTMAGPR